MRDIKLIQAEIAKLEAELEDVKYHEAKTRSAVHILKNLGWTWTRQTGWKKLLTKPEVKAREYKAPVVAGAFAKWDHRVLGGNVYVRSVNASSGTAQVSWLRGVAAASAMIENASFAVRIDELTVKPREYFIGR